MGLIAWLLIGLIAGGIARLLAPSPRGLGCFGTIALGLLGSVVGGTLFNLLFTGDLDVEASGLVGSVIGAVVVLTAVRLMARR